MARNLTDNLYPFSRPTRAIPVVEKGLKPTVLYVNGQKEQSSVAAENTVLSRVAFPPLEINSCTLENS